MNTKYPLEEADPPTGETPPADHGDSNADAPDSTGSSEGDGSGPGGDEEMAEPAPSVEAVVTSSSGAPVDTMETLVLDQGSDTWPPCPWIPKSSLRRWLSKRSTTLEDCKFKSVPQNVKCYYFYIFYWYIIQISLPHFTHQDNAEPADVYGTPVEHVTNEAPLNL